VPCGVLGIEERVEIESDDLSFRSGLGLEVLFEGSGELRIEERGLGLNSEIPCWSCAIAQRLRDVPVVKGLHKSPNRFLRHPTPVDLCGEANRKQRKETPE